MSSTRARGVAFSRVTANTRNRNQSFSMSIPQYARSLTPYSMNLLDGADFVQKLVRWTLFWEIPRALSSIVVRRAYGKASTPAEKSFLKNAPGYVVSTLHAFAVGYFGLRIYTTTLRVPIRDQYYAHAKTLFTKADFEFMEIGNWMFCGYMVSDIIQILWYYPEMGKLDMVAHHLTFIACSFLAGASQTMMLPFSWLLMGEFSTPLLCLRWLIQQGTYELKSSRIVTWAKRLGYRVDKTNPVLSAGKQLEYAASVAFMLSFTVVRVVVYTSGFAMMLSAWRDGILEQVPYFTRSVVLVLVSIGWGLNMYWWSIMVKKALRGPPKPPNEKAE